ncbi:protein trichome birefringence-like 2 isoform X1 [Phalaenopsis equestris]|uniref:protein trichome birefringence-like 2 isoform X1 n=1 Tax=Phalaenopsis equestris TaxID=78828 RepID=UPI0009E1BA29|nr:protein trichome birefringence-like 2 isoform X1 [Phalaenopsis equestris]
MDQQKHLFLDHLIGIMSSKRRVLYGFVLGIAASILVVYLLASINTSGAFPRFLFPRFNGSASASCLGNSNFYCSRTGKNAIASESANRTSVTETLGGNFSQPQSYLGSVKTKQESYVNSLSSSVNEMKKPLFENISMNATDVLEVGRGNVTKQLIGDFRVNIGSSQNFSVSKSGNSDASVKGVVGDSQKKCDIFDGKWVRDSTKPYYAPGSCPYIDIDFDCYKNGRPDDEFLRWRWKPHGCDIPSLNATDFLERLRDRRILFVGDSLNRNMWESLICILRDSVKEKSRVYEVSGRSKFKIKGYYSFRFEDYMCSVDFVRSPFLVKELLVKNANGSENERLRLDLLDETTTAYHQADIVVFNTGHWWTHEKTSNGINYYQEGSHVYPVLEVMKAYRKALTTWSEWVDMYLDSSRTQVVFRGYSLTHFRGGQWNSGGRCHKEIEPIYNETFLKKYPKKMISLEGVLQKMRTPVLYLNVSRLTDYRKDGHPSIYRKKYNSEEELIAAEKIQDCSHWCLPGVPDTWNELLYASLLMEGKGSWRQ